MKVTQIKLSRVELRGLKSEVHSLLNKNPSLGPSELARQFSLPKSTVRNWIDSFKKDKQKPIKLDNLPDAVAFADSFVELLVLTRKDNQMYKVENGLLKQENAYLKTTLDKTQREKADKFRVKLERAIAQPGD